MVIGSLPITKLKQKKQNQLLFTTDKGAEGVKEGREIKFRAVILERK